MTAVERRIAEPPGGAISYREAGTGPALLLMHGIGGNSRSWREQLEALSDRFRVIAWDAPGYGASAARQPDLAGYAGAVADLLDILEIEQAHVVGHSMGGVVAQAVAGLTPARVERLVLSSTFTGDAAPEGTPLGAGWNARLDDIRRMTPEEFGQARAASMLAGSAPDSVRGEAASISAEVTHAGLLAGCRLLHHADTREIAGRLAMPVLMITGAEDNVVPPSRSAMLADLIANCRRAEVPGVGHAGYLEDAKAYNAILSGFLA